MQVFSHISPLRAFLDQKKSLGNSIGFVPTMGALHEGHASLIVSAKSENDITVCSIFVNPKQFNNTEDLAKYPRTLDSDVVLLESIGCDVLFCPSAEEMYPTEPQLKFNFGLLETVMEGKYRPGHFNGVALIVSKLFNLVQPHRAYFGQKDFQQYKIVEQLVTGLSFPIQLKAVPIKREPDGLAMSSRNMRLNTIERKEALIFYNSLKNACNQLINGSPFDAVKQEVVEDFNAKGLSMEYFELADATNLSILNSVSDNAILLIAGYVGKIRLIDNMFVHEN